MYVYLRQIAIPTSLAFLATILWIAQPAYITVWWTIGLPRPYHFALLVFLAGAIVIRRLNLDSPVPLVLAGASFLLFAMAARSEYFVALLFFVGLVAALSRSRSEPLLRAVRGTYLWPVCFLAGAATLVTGMYLMGRVPAESRFLTLSRSWYAFGQHFSVYFLKTANVGGKLDPWDDWELIVGQTFPGAHSVLGAALANPKVLLGFELHNLNTAPRVINAYLTAYVTVFPPYILLKASVLYLTLLCLSFITLTSVSALKSALFMSVAALGPYVLAGIATVIPGTLITSRINYFLPLLFVFFVVAVKWLSVVLENKPAVYRSVAAAFAVVIALTFVATRSSPGSSFGVQRPMLMETSEIRAILERQRVGGARILQNQGPGYSAFLPGGLSETVDPDDRRDTERFWEFTERLHIEAMLVDDRLRSSRLYRNDRDFASFLASPAQFGWIAAPVGIRGDVFYLRYRKQNSVR